MIRVADTGKEVFFTHYDEVTGKQTVYAVERLVKWCEDTNVPAVPIEIDRVYARWMVWNRGIETHRAFRMMNANLQALPPVVFCQQPEGSHLLVDGTHRYVEHARRGLTTIRGYLLTREQWEPFIVVDAPEVPVDVMMALPSQL